jgi:hypothetical protein
MMSPRNLSTLGIVFLIIGLVYPATAAADTLNRHLEDYERSSGHQLIVYIAQTTGDARASGVAGRIDATRRCRRDHCTVNELAVKDAFRGLRIPMAPVVAPTGIHTHTLVSLMT